MTRLDALFAIWSASFAAYSAVCLLVGIEPWQLHLGLLFVYLVNLAVILRRARIGRWYARHLTRLARQEILCRAWDAVLMDRAARGCQGVTHARLGLIRALDLAHSELARSAP